MRPLTVPVHQYAEAMLDYFAARGNESKESVLERILDGYAAQHITELVANVPLFRDAASFLGATTINARPGPRHDAAVRCRAPLSGDSRT